VLANTNKLAIILCFVTIFFRHLSTERLSVTATRSTERLGVTATIVATLYNLSKVGIVDW